ncbi:hypothetical protein IGI04_026085 [Brassica rapa subsp. trilocularis]|uniref:Uncharacterized protein n=1 Tax=Brassica rapa subsp. trilocularis TaxID=1813537 RepID=A0ABQ7KVB3_BRACM|nr:hypothetical protein IGI04_026085 [Brassica rapa subsp. trilocularis]
MMITVNCSCDTEQGHEDTMMGSHPGSRVTACSVSCSIFEYLMAMMAGDLTLGREGTSLASDLLTENLENVFKVRVPYDISPCPNELTIGYCFFSGDQKYSENLRSTIEEHQPCHFRSTMIGVSQYHSLKKQQPLNPERLREHAKEGTDAISYEPDVEKTLRRNTSSNRTEITHSLICFMVILA